MGLYERCSEGVAHYYGWRTWDQVLEHSFRDESGKKVFKKVGKFVKKAAGVVLPIAGTAIGGFFGGPAGAAIGGKIGGAVGGFFSAGAAAREAQAGPPAVQQLLQPFGGERGAIEQQAQGMLTRAGLSRNAGAILTALGGLTLADVAQRRQLAGELIGPPGPLQAGLATAGKAAQGLDLSGILQGIFGGGKKDKQKVAGVDQGEAFQQVLRTGAGMGAIT